MGDKILALEKQSEIISEKEQLDSQIINLEQDRADYADTSTMAGSYMATVIDAMEKAMGNNSSANARDLAAKAVKDAQKNIESRMEGIRQELNRYDTQITNDREQADSLRRSIHNAVAGTDTTSLTNSLNNFVQQIERETAAQSALQEEYSQLDAASRRLQYYETTLGLNNDSSSIAIRTTLLEMQSEFFQDNPDEEKLLDTATSIFESLRNAASQNEDDSLSYSNLLVQMNQLILNLRDYSDMKAIESSLDNLIVELRNEAYMFALSEKSEAVQEEGTEGEEDTQAGTEGDSAVNKDNKKTVKEKWKEIWRNRLERLKAQISSMPVYSVGTAENQDGAGILTNSQMNILRSYNRSDSSNHLDKMIRFYIVDHNALYQGIIYLQSPYKMLAIFSLILAVAFDLSGFILGFISQGEDQGNKKKEKTAPAEYMLNAGLREGKVKRAAKRENLTADWSIIPSRNKYKVLTGDYEKKNKTYMYQVFEDSLLQKWNVEDSKPYGQGIYLQDKETDTKGILVENAQEIVFAHQAEEPKDGIYLGCGLEFDEESLLLVDKETSEKSFLANINEFVPVHSYSPSREESQIIPAKDLSSDKITGQFIVIALNDKGTRIAAIYIIES